MKRICVVSILILVSACAHRVSEKDSETARIHYDMGIAALNQGELRNALRELLRAAQADPEFAQAQHVLGLVYYGMNRPKDALTHFRRAVALKPEFSEAHNNLGVLLLDIGRYDEAIAAFEVALSDILYATPSLAEGNMGWAYYLKGEIDPALRHLRNAVATNPKFCRGYEWLARIGVDTKKPEQVLANYRRFERHCLEDGSIASGISEDYKRQMLYYLGLGYINQGDHDQAREVLARCADGQTEGGFAAKCAYSLSMVK